MILERFSAIVAKKSQRGSGKGGRGESRDKLEGS